MTDEPEALMPGPCVVCGLTDYPLSMGGPAICPQCDCGNFGIAVVKRQRDEIERLETELREAITRATNEHNETIRLQGKIERHMREKVELAALVANERTEIERLQAELRKIITRAIHEHNEETIRLQGEIERLRAKGES